MPVITAHGGSKQEDQEFKAKPWLHREFEVNLNYRRLCLQKT